MNPILLRKQLENNASDLQDFCKDLKNWGQEMKRKEEALKSGDNQGSQSNKIDNKKVKKSDKTKKLKQEIASKKPGTKIGVTDYSAWDKFDADAECEKLEEDINEDEDSELTDECNDNMQDLAIIEKEKGNKFVKNQKWDEAITCYTKAIEYFSYDPIFYANRALCHLKKNSFEEAEKDCNLSLKLDNTYVKAYQRRAAAREGLSKLDHAEFDLLRVLELEPNNTGSKQSLEKLRKRLGKTEKVSEQRPVSKFTASRNKSNISGPPLIKNLAVSAKQNVEPNEIKKVVDTSKPIPIWPEQDDIVLVRAINKPPHLRSKKPLKRIDIVENDSSIIESNIIESEPEAIKKHVFEKQEKVEATKDVSAFKKERIETKNEDSSAKISAFKMNQTDKAMEKSFHLTAFPKPDTISSSIKSDDFKIIEKEPPDVLINQHSVISKDVKNISNRCISSGNSKTENEKLNSAFVKPKTSVQFNLTWKNVECLAEKYQYLKQMDPQDFPKIFMNSLESNVFSGILEVLAEHFIKNKDPVFNILDNFTRVKRFGTFTMFMSATDKKNLWKLFDYIKEVEQKNKEDVDRLIEKYEM